MNINRETQIALIRAYFKDTEHYLTHKDIIRIDDSNSMYWEVKWSGYGYEESETVYISDLLCWLFLRGEKK